MQIRQNEVTTGLLVLVTFGIFIVILVIIGMPGLIQPLNTYRIYFDNAEGIRPGAPVLLAGREIGKVISLKSPIPSTKRPTGHPDDEVSIDVQVARDAEIYRNVTVRLTQQSLMGQEVIDFVHGDESTGLVKNHAEFTGERVPDISESVADNMARLTGPESDLAHTIQNVKRLTEPDSELSLAVANFEHLTEPDADLSLTLKNTKIFMETLNGSHVRQVIDNTQQLTDTLKREPWRLVWPSTKTYPSSKPTPTTKTK